ncbi:ChaB family protein [Enteractinococcus coprophilus]|uniref:Rho termination factor-like protein n=1 Tax=Enteractinococcus coprophilus TaxID=1027633 RepID=A0A543AMU8_9MICC|nr:ChaB family protein [Enteractinococcus coprophilus]TQL73903.1 Rho termination factor-like protein [Enteractinococcus coprophilus]
MPKTKKSGEAKKSELPKTLKKSPKKAQRTFAKAYDSAMDQYNDEERAHRTAWDAVKKKYEKVGDHWERKPKKGDSDKQAAGGKNTDHETAGGIDANATKEHLYEQAQKLDIEGRSKMTKDELIEALQKESNRRTSKNS